MRRTLVWLLPLFSFIACKRGPEGPAGPPGPAGPNYVSPNQQGYIRGVIIAQDTFNNQRARENYNHIYYTQSPCDVDPAGPDTIQFTILRSSSPYTFTEYSSISIKVDTGTSPPAVVGVETEILYTKRVGNNLLLYSQSFDTNDNQDTLLIESLTLSPQLTQVRGRLRGVRRSVTPHDTVTFEFESVIPRKYQ